MAEILLTHSYFLHFDPKQQRAHKPYPPLACLYVASVLRNQGHDIAFFDTMFAHNSEAFRFALQKAKPNVVILCEDGFNYLTKMCLLNMRKAAFEMIKMCSELGLKVIVSSSDATDRSREYLEAGADFIVVGEAENTISELVQKIQQNEPTDEINGLRYLTQGLVKQTQPRMNSKTLDDFPMPAWDLVPMDEYKSRWLQHHGYFSINMVTTRGCPFKCNWCAKPIYGNRYNSRSPENVVEELKYLQQYFHADHIWFCDDIFGLKPGWVEKFSSLIRSENIKVKFKIQSRADLLLTENTVSDLALAGCEEIWVGAESGSQKILDAMDKGTTVEQIKESTFKMKKHGIHPCFFLQFGYPGEEAEDIQKTLQLVRDLMPYDIGVSVSYPLPGTGFYEKVKSQMNGKANWEDSDDLVTLFNGTFPSGFYKKLQRFVHRDFRKKQALQDWKDSGNPMYAVKLMFRIPQSILAFQRIKKYVYPNSI